MTAGDKRQSDQPDTFAEFRADDRRRWLERMDRHNKKLTEQRREAKRK